MEAIGPRLCMMMSAARASRAAIARPTSARQDTSLTRCAPAARASRATRGEVVSMETRAPRDAASSAAHRTGPRTRASCSSSDTAADPGRVDSPPMSMISAPSSSSAAMRPGNTAGAAKTPPSLKESGVTLSTPIKRGRRSLRARSRRRESSLTLQRYQAGREPASPGLAADHARFAWRAVGPCADRAPVASVGALPGCRAASSCCEHGSERGSQPGSS
jgi:hypothetical protein